MIWPPPDQPNDTAKQTESALTGRFLFWGQLVSDVFSARSPNSIGHVSEFDVLNEHIVADGVGNHKQSDHGLVVVELTPKT